VPKDKITHSNDDGVNEEIDLW